MEEFTRSNSAEVAVLSCMLEFDYEYEYEYEYDVGCSSFENCEHISWSYCEIFRNSVIVISELPAKFGHCLIIPSVAVESRNYLLIAFRHLSLTVNIFNANSTSYCLLRVRVPRSLDSDSESLRDIYNNTGKSIDSLSVSLDIIQYYTVQL